MKASVNPFRSSQLAYIRYELSTQNLESLAQRALALSATCLLGVKGTGKTTLLEDLAEVIESRGQSVHWVRLSLSSSLRERAAALAKLEQLDTHSACFFDGGEVLSRWQWWRVCRAARAQGFVLIATLHQQRGLPILHQTQPNWPLAKRFVQELAGTHYSQALQVHAQQAFAISQGNMREVFRACYLALAHEK
jgi:ABC-type hemin transport system ATPase subunit